MSPKLIPNYNTYYYTYYLLAMYQYSMYLYMINLIYINVDLMWAITPTPCLGTLIPVKKFPDYSIIRGH